MTARARFCRAVVCLGMLAAVSAAGEEAPALPQGADVHYVPLQPSFVTNFGEGTDHRLHYVKADVSLRVHGQDAADAARYHLPALRNALVLLFARQDEASMSTGSGRETLRAEALAEIRGILEAEEGQAYVDDVLFTNFLVQR